MLKEVKGVWLPETEEHMLQHATVDQWCYQGHKFLEALKWCTGFDVAVDVGAHCGLWSKQMSLAFRKIYAFEPVPLHQDAFRKNVEGDYKLFPFACGNKEGVVRIKTFPHSSGDANVDDEGDVEARMVRIDDVLNTPCDFLKIDAEGYEELVLMGAKRLLRSKPCVIVEQKPDKAQKYGLRETGAVQFLKRLGARQKAVIFGDYIMSWDE